MDLRAMRYFIAIVDQGSLTRAAEVVCVAQPALSQQLATLEKELGVPLVHRGAKGVKPTEAGRTLYRHARNILRQVEIAGARSGWRARMPPAWLPSACPPRRQRHSACR